MSERASLNESTSSAEASPVRTSAAREPDAVLPDIAPGCGSSTCDSSESRTPASSSSRTLRAERSCGYPRSVKGSKGLGIEPVPSRFLPSTLEPHIFVDASSLLPTPTASSYGTNQGGAAGRVGKVRMSLHTMVRRGLLATPTAKGNQLCPSMKKWPGCEAWQAVHPPGPLLPSFVEWMMGFPDGWTSLSAKGESEPLATPSSRSALKLSAA